MTEELQGLLDRIQKDGVDKAEAEAKTIADRAKQLANETREQAEKEAANIRQKAEQDAEAFAVRGRHALEQAARDVVLSLHEAINTTLASLVKGDVAKILDGDAVAGLLSQVLEAYSRDSTGSTPIEVLVPADIKGRIVEHFMARLSETVGKGVEIKSVDDIMAGFRVSFVNDRVEHDFSDASIADALCRILRPHLADVVRNAVKEKTQEKSD